MEVDICDFLPDSAVKLEVNLHLIVLTEPVGVAV